MKSEGIIRRMLEHEGDRLVSFPGHDAYFKVEDSAVWRQLQQAEAAGQAVAFEYGRDMVIHYVEALA